MPLLPEASQALLEGQGSPGWRQEALDRPRKKTEVEQAVPTQQETMAQ